MITIAELRARNGKMSQKELAEALNVSPRTVTNWEKDQMSISSKSIVKLALYFRVSTDDLLGVSQK